MNPDMNVLKMKAIAHVSLGVDLGGADQFRAGTVLSIYSQYPQFKDDRIQPTLLGRYVLEKDCLVSNYAEQLQVRRLNFVFEVEAFTVDFFKAFGYAIDKAVVFDQRPITLSLSFTLSLNDLEGFDLRAHSEKIADYSKETAVDGIFRETSKHPTASDEITVGDITFIGKAKPKQQPNFGGIYQFFTGGI